MSKTKDSRVGWIYPHGKIVEIPLYEHIQYFFKDEEARQFLGFDSLDSFESWADERSGEEQREFIGSCGDGHVPWHCFWGYPEEIKRQHIYDSGFLRWGTYVNKYNELIVVVDCVSGSDIPDTETMHELMDLAETNHCHCTYQKYKQTITKKFERIDNEIRLTR